MGKYDDLKKLNELRSDGAITDAEYEQEKAKIFHSDSSSELLLGMDEKTYIMLMHLSQFAGYIIVGLGFIFPIVLWLTGKRNSNVDKHGKNIANFMLSMFIYCFASALLIFLLIGIPLLIILAVLQVIFIIIAAVKANNEEYWEYPLAFKFFS